MGRGCSIILVICARMAYNVIMHEQTDYNILVRTLVEHFGERLKMMVLFGLQSRGDARVFVKRKPAVPNLAPLGRCNLPAQAEKPPFG